MNYDVMGGAKRSARSACARTPLPYTTLSAVEKSKLYSDQLNRFLLFKNKMAHYSPGIPETSVQSIPHVPAEMSQHIKSVEITPPVPATSKPNFLTQPPT